MDVSKIKAYLTQIGERFKVPLNTGSQLLAQDNGRFTTLPTIVELGIVESTTELEAQKGQSESFASVFGRWDRISRNDDPTAGDAVNPDELETWVYHEDTDTIECTKNTSTFVGFVSPDAYDDFIMEVEVNSAGDDDDFIGVIAAYALDSDGVSHVLSVMRGLNNIAPMAIYKDRGSFSGNAWQLPVYEGLTWADGTVADGSAAANAYGGWDTITVPYKIKITRKGDILTIETSNTGETTYFDPAKTVIDLSSVSELEVFRGPQRFGYCCLSQEKSTWNVLQRPGAKKPIYDLPNQQLWTFEDGNWVSEDATVAQAVAQGVLVPEWMHFNPQTGSYFFMEPGNALVKV